MSQSSLPEDSESLKAMVRSLASGTRPGEQRAEEQQQHAEEQRRRAEEQQAASRGTPRRDAAASARIGAFQEVVLRPARGPAAIERRCGADAARLLRGIGPQAGSSGQRSARGRAGYESCGACGGARAGAILPISRTSPSPRTCTNWARKNAPARAAEPSARRSARTRAGRSNTIPAISSASSTCARSTPARRVTATAPARRSKRRRSRNPQSKRGWPGRDCSVTSSRVSSPITCRCTGWKTSSRDRVSRSRGQRSRSGVATWRT